MAGRSPARFLAPLALVAFALALFVVVSSTTKDDAGSRGARDAGQPAQSTSTPDGEEEARKTPKRRRTYTVKPGDTPSGIAEKVGVDVEDLFTLNPDLDPQTLAPGTKIRLR
jgi:LysM repeat protein